MIVWLLCEFWLQEVLLLLEGHTLALENPTAYIELKAASLEFPFDLRQIGLEIQILKLSGRLCFTFYFS